MNITDKVKSFEDACDVLGIDKSYFLEIHTNIPQLKDEVESYMAFIKMTIICKALNEGWTPNWEDSNEYKYCPYFDMRSGVGFSFHDYSYAASDTIVGSRIVYRSSELAIYAGKQFIDIYKKIMVK